MRARGKGGEGVGCVCGVNVCVCQMPVVVKAAPAYEEPINEPSGGSSGKVCAGASVQQTRAGSAVVGQRV